MLIYGREDMQKYLIELEQKEINDNTHKDF